MTETFHAEAAIEVGHHTEAHWFGLTVNTDTVLATAIAAVIVLALAFFLRAKVTSTGVPGGVQLFWEAITVQTARPDRGRDRHEDRAVRAAARGDAVRVHPDRQLALRVSRAVHRLVTAPFTNCSSRPHPTSTSCWRWLCSCSSATTRQASGAAAPSGTHGKLLKGHVTLMAPINLVEELAKPISLSLRLFGNIFAGGILVALIALFPPYILWLPNAIWKSFDLFVGAIQAFIFALLTILYFSQSMELDEDHH